MNLQLIEKRIERTNDALEVHSIFPTIQGEGPFVGHPSVFVRLAGCNLQCPACDTDYTSNRERLLPNELMSRILDYHKKGLIVLTGGEPLRQACGPFIKTAITYGFQVQIETNGTLWDNSLDEYDFSDGGLTIVCSPKTGALAYPMRNAVDHLKYILEAGKVDPLDGLPMDSLNTGVKPCRPWERFLGGIYVQPMDSQDSEKNKANLSAAIESCQAFGYILCVQLHKLIGLP